MKGRVTWVSGACSQPYMKAPCLRECPCRSQYSATCAAKAGLLLLSSPLLVLLLGQAGCSAGASADLAARQFLDVQMASKVPHALCSRAQRVQVHKSVHALLGLVYEGKAACGNVDAKSRIKRSCAVAVHTAHASTAAIPNYSNGVCRGSYCTSRDSPLAQHAAAAGGPWWRV